MRSSARRRVRSAPSNAIRPERAGKSPMIVLSSVVFPTPLRPMRQTTPPAGTSRETSQRIWLSPYATLSPLISSMGTLGMGVAAAPQVDLHHALVLLHLVHRALAQHAALVK